MPTIRTFQRPFRKMIMMIETLYTQCKGLQGSTTFPDANVLRRFNLHARLFFPKLRASEDCKHLAPSDLKFKQLTAKRRVIEGMKRIVAKYPGGFEEYQKKVDANSGQEFDH